jgi:hypothetical protein
VIRLSSAKILLRAIIPFSQLGLCDSFPHVISFSQLSIPQQYFLRFSGRCRPQKFHPDDNSGTSRDYWICAMLFRCRVALLVVNSPAWFSVSF